MHILLNGNEHQCPSTMTIQVLLESLDIPLDTVVVECNGEIIAATAWSETFLQANDVLEVVRFVGGG